MRNTKTKLLASAAIMALALGTTSKARAFDDVSWSWDKTVTNIENITITVNDTFDWSGLVEIEKIQANIGDVSANSTVHGIDNNAPGGLEGTVTAPVTLHLDDTIHVTADYTDAAPAVDDNALSPFNGGVVTSDGGFITGTVQPTGGVNEFLNDAVGLSIDLSGDVTGEAEVDLSDVTFDGVRDAVDLPEVLSAATAVANNQVIESTSAINLHDGQYNFGGFNVVGGNTDGQGPAISSLLLLGFADQTDNSHTDAALGLTIAGALGIITPGSVEANSTVYDIHNATVDSSATAVGNNMSVTLEPLNVGDAVAIADLTQFNYADVSATSQVCDVTIDNYANLGVLDKPIVSSVATAVGNNVSIKVGNFDAP